MRRPGSATGRSCPPHKQNRPVFTRNGFVRDFSAIGHFGFPEPVRAPVRSRIRLDGRISFPHEFIPKPQTKMCAPARQRYRKVLPPQTKPPRFRAERFVRHRTFQPLDISDSPNPFARRFAAAFAWTGAPPSRMNLYQNRKQACARRPGSATGRPCPPCPPANKTAPFSRGTALCGTFQPLDISDSPNPFARRLAAAFAWTSAPPFRMNCAHAIRSDFSPGRFAHRSATALH